MKIIYILLVSLLLFIPANAKVSATDANKLFDYAKAHGALTGEGPSWTLSLEDTKNNFKQYIVFRGEINTLEIELCTQSEKWSKDKSGDDYIDQWLICEYNSGGKGLTMHRVIIEDDGQVVRILDYVVDKKQADKVQQLIIQHFLQTIKKG